MTLHRMILGLPSKSRVDLQLKKEGQKLAQDSAQSPLKLPPLFPMTSLSPIHYFSSYKSVQKILFPFWYQFCAITSP